MKTLRETCAATILCLALTGSAFAGQISSPGAVSPPPPPPSEEASPTSNDAKPADNVTGQTNTFDFYQGGDATTTIILTIISLLP